MDSTDAEVLLPLSVTQITFIKDASVAPKGKADPEASKVAKNTTSDKNKNTKTEIIDSPIQTQFDYVDREGVRWNKDNIFAPRKNESLNDPNYQKRMEVFRKEVDPYEKGYEEGYNDAKREYGN